MIQMYYGTEPIEMVVHQADSLTLSEEETAIIEQGEWEPPRVFEYHATLRLSEEEAAQLVYALTGIRTRRHKKGTSAQKPPYINRLHPRKDTFTRPYWLRIRSNPTRRNYH